MLKHLYIQNFILIDEINLDFESGFSAFTGETGAGKSILIDAISTLSLTSASSTLIAKGKRSDMRRISHRSVLCLVPSDF